MNPSGTPRVKICCMASVQEMETAVQHGASAVGLVSEMPSGPGPIDEETIARIARQVPPPVMSVLLTSRQDARAIVDQHRRCATGALQLVDHVDASSHRILREELPGIAIIQVIHVLGRESIDESVEASRNVQALLLDSGNPRLTVKELGGTGRVHDWSISRAIREAVEIPVFLAGGLSAENVGPAIRTVRPFGVDVCSGVRTNGRLDEVKLTAFMRAAVTALEELKGIKNEE